MAMTKKEQAAMQAAIDRAETLAALRWTGPVEPDVAPPKYGEGYTQGWSFNAHSATVDFGWSSSIYHGRGEAPKEGEFRSGSQQPRWFFSSETLALQALRHVLEKRAAESLLAVDRRIAALAAQAQETSK